MCVCLTNLNTRGVNIESPQAPARLAMRPLARRGYWIKVAAGGVAYSRSPLVRETRSSPITAWNGNGTPTGMPWNGTKEGQPAAVVSSHLCERQNESGNKT